MTKVIPYIFPFRKQLNPIDFEEYKLLIEEIEEEGLSQSEEQEIYKAAEENIKNIIVNFLSGMDDYQVKFL